MGKKIKDKEKKKQKKAQKLLLKSMMIGADCKSKCCEKFRKSEDKRCKRCPMFDLIQKVA